MPSLASSALIVVIGAELRETLWRPPMISDAPLNSLLCPDVLVPPNVGIVGLVSVPCVNLILY